MAGKKVFFIGLGVFATGVAIIGVWLPGIPTTFPLIVALWAFSKSSKRLYVWASSLPVLKQALGEAERFERERNIDIRIKILAAGSAWVSALVVGLLTRNMFLTMLVAISALSCTAFMLYIPTRQSDAGVISVDEE